MIFTQTPLPGAFIVEIEPRADERGFFARTFCQREFLEHGLNPAIAQVSIAHNRRGGTVRGMHFQLPPRAETKLVRVTRGAILDVIVDLRPESATYLQHLAVELTAENRLALYVPARFAHGYQSLVDDTEAQYEISEFHAPGTEGGLSPFDPRLGIRWPRPVTAISAKDGAWRPLDEIEGELRSRMVADR